MQFNKYIHTYIHTYTYLLNPVVIKAGGSFGSALLAVIALYFYTSPTIPSSHHPIIPTGGGILARGLLRLLLFLSCQPVIRYNHYCIQRIPGGGTSTTACPSRSTGAYATPVAQLPEVHPRTVRPIERSRRPQNPYAKNRGTRDNAVRLRPVEPARVPLRHAAPSPPQVLDSLHRLAKKA